MEWIADPTAWAGLVTLVLLEIILGIDNLVFIAILAQKLPSARRAIAARTGLLLALVMRVVLLSGISWLSGLTKPIADIAGHELSWREIILLIGGGFLLMKATLEIHARLEGRGEHAANSGYKAQFWMVVAQIVVLDAVFSLDAVITAVGMVDELQVMILAVIIAILLMTAVSKPLTDFVQKHPTVVMLCLGFLLMVGFSLVAEGFGIYIPKGYLYAAIGFSLLIEFFNQFARAKLKRRVKADEHVRQRTADAILRLLGAKQAGEGGADAHEMGVVMQEGAKASGLSNAEKYLLRGVLNLSERPVHTIMTPRQDIEYVDIHDAPENIFNEIRGFDRSHILVVDGDLDHVLGILRKDEYLIECMDGGPRPVPQRLLMEPLFVQHTLNVMALLDIFKKYPAPMAVINDEAGGLDGIVTHLDVLEAISGEFPERHEPYSSLLRENADGSLTIDAGISIYELRDRLTIDYDPDGRFGTLAGLVLHELGRIPAIGDKLDWHGWTIDVRQMEGRRISQVRMTRLSAP
ncbi:MAG: TerC family protein [Micavibrio sp.]|nr:TerC family protein [Micavibrio sp.]